MCKRFKDLFILENFWDQEFCDALISFSETSGYFPNPLNKNNSIDNISERNNYRIDYENKFLADTIWEHIKESLSMNVFGFYPSGINNHFRIYKYFPGHEFKTHEDASTKINDNELSFYSLLIYLNEAYEGGETVFENFKISPTTGKAVTFPHSLLHSGSIVKKGIKYILRTDIIFTRK